MVKCISTFSINSKNNKRYECKLIGDYCIVKNSRSGINYGFSEYTRIFGEYIDIIYGAQPGAEYGNPYPYGNSLDSNLTMQNAVLNTKSYSGDSCSDITYFHLEILDIFTQEMFSLPFYEMNNFVRIEYEDSEALRIISENKSIADNILTQIKSNKTYYQLVDRRILKNLENPISFVNQLGTFEIEILGEVHHDSEAIKNAVKLLKYNREVPSCS